MSATSPRARIAAFLVLTFALSSFFYVRIIAAGRLRMLPVLGLMWCPGAAALILRLVSQRNLRGTGWTWGATRWQAVAFAVPPALGIVVYGIAWATGIGRLTPAALGVPPGTPGPAPLVFAIVAVLGFVQSVAFALGEEIGWRGFLVPELARITSFAGTALTSGVIWSVYHYPLILFANYHGGAPRWFGLVAFTWMVVASSVIYAWLRLKSGSVWTGAILHASHNFFVQGVFDQLTSDRGLARYLTGEFGVGLAIAYTAAAVYFWRRRSEVPTADTAVVTAATA